MIHKVVLSFTEKNSVFFQNHSNPPGDSNARGNKEKYPIVDAIRQAQLCNVFEECLKKSILPKKEHDFSDHPVKAIT